MPSGASKIHATSGRAGTTSARLRRELLATLVLGTALEEPRSTTTPLDQVLSPLAGLLIARWAGYDESEREAIAAFNEEVFKPELPEALGLSAWDDPTRNHVGEVAEALGTMATRNGAESAAVRYVNRVAPLVMHTAEESPPTYERLYACVRQIDFGAPDGRTLAARMFDDVLRTVMAMQGKQVGEFATPERVADLMLALADPQPGDKVYDPCFGFGELLVGAARRLREAARTAPTRVWAGIRQAGIFGIEINRLSYAVGLCRILLAGIDRPGLELSDALERPLPRSRSGDGFDCIMAVPPWGMRVSRTPTAHFPFPNRHSETLFLQHVMANLRPGGRAVVALPEGLLYRHGPDRRMRKALLSDYSVDAVVSLPAGAFAPWTGIPVNLVAFRRDEPQAAVRFIGIPPDTWKSAPEDRDTLVPDGRDSDGRGLGVGVDSSRDSGEFRGVADSGAGLVVGGGLDGSSGPSAGCDDGSGFGGGFGAGAGFSDGGGLGRGYGSGAVLGHGGRYGDGVGTGVRFEDGTGFGHGAGMTAESGDGMGVDSGRTHAADLFRCVADLSRRRPGISADALPFRVETWDVPVQKLALRDHELVARKSGSDALDAEIDRLVASDPSLKIERLERVAEVRAGRLYPTQFTTARRDAPNAVAGLIRVGDVKDTVDARDSAGEITKDAWIAEALKPVLFLTGDGMARADEREILRPLDIVVTTSGTVGKVAFFPVLLAGFDLEDVSASASCMSDLRSKVAGLSMPMVITKGVAVLRARGHVTPEYLAALLRSPAYRSWLSGNARGTTIQHLTLRTLRRLPIPVPPVPVQKAVLDELSGLRGDAMAVLARLLSGASNDPVTVWLETPLVARLASGSTGGNASDSFGALVAAARALYSLVIRIQDRSDRTSSEMGDRRIGGWLGVARQVAMTLDGVESIPRGAGRLAILEVTLSRLQEALRVLEGTGGSVVDRLRSFTRAMVESAEGEVHAMQGSIRLDIAVEPAEVTVGATSEVDLRVTNSSAVPMRSLHVSTRPPVGTGQLPYLADGETHRFPLTVHPRDASRPLPVAVSWRARRLDGTAVGGEVEVSLRVLSTREVVRTGGLGSSPYIVSSPVYADREDMFFGRADIIEPIKRQLGASTHANVVLLEGNRRTGKTSILEQLGKAGVLSGWIPVYCSFQGAEGHDSKVGIATREVFRLLAREIGRALHDAGVETWIPGQPARDPGRSFKAAFRVALDRAFAGEHGFEMLQLYIAAAVEAASPRRVLLMLDEFDKLHEGIEAGITSPQVPENIRHLLQHQPGLCAIIAGSRRLKRLREQYWSALFGLGYRLGVSALPLDDARRLVTQPVEGRLGYLPHARDRLVELCACHPFLVQSLCNRMFEQAASGGTPTITVEAVEQAATEMVRDNEHFKTLWDYAGSARRRLILALCDRCSEGPDPVSLELLEIKLRDNGVPVRRFSELSDDVAELRELELIEFDDSYRGGTYRLSVPLMARWLQVNVDFDDVVKRAKQEADTVEAGR